MTHFSTCTRARWICNDDFYATDVIVQLAHCTAIHITDEWLTDAAPKVVRSISNRGLVSLERDQGTLVAYDARKGKGKEPRARIKLHNPRWGMRAYDLFDVSCQDLGAAAVGLPETPRANRVFIRPLRM